MDIGSAVSRASGLAEEKLLALPQYESSTAFSELERQVLRYADALTATPAQVPQELFAALEAELGEAGLVELTAAIAWENYRARFNRAFEVEAEGFLEGAHCLLPAPPAGKS